MRAVVEVLEAAAMEVGASESKEKPSADNEAKSPLAEAAELSVVVVVVTSELSKVNPSAESEAKMSPLEEAGELSLVIVAVAASGVSRVKPSAERESKSLPVEVAADEPSSAILVKAEASGTAVAAAAKSPVLYDERMSEIIKASVVRQKRDKRLDRR